MKRLRLYSVATITVSAILIIGMAAGCGTNTGKQAGTSAAIGGLAGAAGGALSAAIFGGNVGEAAARGAAWGAGAGAVSGAVAGSQMDEAAANTPEAKIEKLKQDIGDDAFNGLAALADCNHSEALANAEKAKASSNSEFAAAGLWIEALTYYDSRQEAKARAMYPDILKMDKHVSSEGAVEEHMRKAMGQIGDIREEFNKSRTCR